MNASHRIAAATLACSAVAAGAALTLLLGACSGDDRAASSGGEVDGSVPDSGPATLDAASITPRPELCEGLTRGRDAVPEFELLGDAPAPLGGAVVPGTYDLVELYVYSGRAAAAVDGGEEETPSTRLTGRAAHVTIVIGEFEMRVIDARGAADSDATTWREDKRASLYRLDGTDIVGTAVCPATALPVRLPFSAVGGGLAIFADATHREVYSRRP